MPRPDIIKPLLGDNHDDGVLMTMKMTMMLMTMIMRMTLMMVMMTKMKTTMMIRREDALRPPRPDIIKTLQVVPALKMEQGSNWLAWTPLK